MYKAYDLQEYLGSIDSNIRRKAGELAHFSVSTFFDGSQHKIQEARKETTPDFVTLLKFIVKQAEHFWGTEDCFKNDRNILGTDQESTEKVRKAVLYHDFAGIPDFSGDFYKVLQAASRFQDLIRLAVVKLLELESGILDDFDRALVVYSALISHFYDNYYLAWAKAMQNSATAKLLKDILRNTPDTLKELQKTHLYNQYTVNVLKNSKEYLPSFSDYPEVTLSYGSKEYVIKFVPYAVYFQKELKPIVTLFNELINQLKLVNSNTNGKNSSKYQAIIDYLQGYKKALECTKVSKLEDIWKQLDILWMQFFYHIEVVHDIEYDYGDPLRIKVIPDFSIRFLDSAYAKENKQIQHIKDRLLKFFKQNTKSGDILENGLFALKHSFAGIFSLPFVSGMAVHFKFSGQSLPNRQDIRAKYGSKIYFDPVATSQRAQKVVELANKVLAKPITIEQVDAILAIVYHVTAHEFGHAIYGLRNLTALENKYASLMEEWRAERVSLAIMLYLYEKGDISENELKGHLFSFALYDLRRFADFNSSTLRPYIISAIDAYNIYEKLGYAKVENGKLVFDRSKTIEILEHFKADLLTMLKAITDNNPEPVIKLYNKANKPGALVKWLIEKLG